MAYSSKLRIGSAWVYPPDGYQEGPIPSVGVTLNRRNVRQGYGSIIFTWKLLNQEKFATIWNAWMACLASGDTRVEIEYVDKENGGMIIQFATMYEPVIGGRHTVFYDNVAVKFTHLAGDY